MRVYTLESTHMLKDWVMAMPNKNCRRFVF